MTTAARRIEFSTYFVVGLLLLLSSAAAWAQDQIGIYWDADFTQNTAETSLPFEVLNGHIVISDPTVGGGILGWECEVAVEGPGIATGWSIEGQAINAQTPPRFAVGLAAPLPPAAATQVATFELIVTEVEAVRVKLKPIFFASIPHEMAYLGGDLPDQLTVLHPVTNNAIVATVNENAFAVEVSPLFLDFDVRAVGRPSIKFVTVTNVGGGILPLDLSIGGTDPGFSLETLSGAVGLGPGERVVIPVTFTPSEIGLATANLQLGEHAADVPLTGTGREAVASWSVGPTLLFGDVVLGDLRDLNSWIRNTGDLPLEVNISLIDDCAEFSINSGSGPHTLTPGQILYTPIRFAPQALGVQTCTLSYGAGFPEVALNGTGIYAPTSATVTPSAVHFSFVDFGQTPTQIVRVTNTGNTAFPIDPHLTGLTTPFSLGVGAQAVDLPPGATWNIQVTFTPETVGYFTDSLFIGNGIELVPVTGSGGAEVLICDVSTSLLEFEIDSVGQSQSRSFTVTNLGNSVLDLNPTLVDSDEFSVSPSAPFSLAPGSPQIIQVTYRPTDLGIDTGLLHLGSQVCSSVALRGFASVEIQPGENLVGFFFDSNFTAIETGVEGSPVTIPVYLALINPSEPSGVAGWECRLETTGGADFVGWDLAGNAINVPNLNDPSEFTVGVGLEPLPYAADGVLLATFQLYIHDPDPNNVTLELHPKRNPSIPDLMAWVPWSDVTQLTPMVPLTGLPTVAWINTGVPVGVEVPTPLAIQQGGRIDLEWPMHALEGDGYHVYRQDPQDRDERLTSSPLPATTTTIRYSDQPDYPGGTVLRYSYSLVRDGIEVTRSHTVDVTVKSLPPVRTQLLSNVPNPFNPQTEIRFQLAQTSQVRITIYDVTGRLVRTLVNEQRGAGAGQAVWRGRDDSGRRVSSGAYYVRLENEGQIDHRKIMMLK